MTEPYALPNEVTGVLTSAFVFGTDNHLHLVAIGLFPTGGGRFRVYTVDKAHWALLEYTGVSTNDLTGLTQANLTGNLYTDAAYTFPAGSIVDRVAMGEDVSSRIMGPASATDGHLLVADGTSGKKAKDGGVAVANPLTAPLDAAGYAITDLGATTAFKFTGDDAVVRSAKPRPAQCTIAATTFYVSAASGNDTTGTGTAVAPFATIQKAIDLLPEIIAHQCYINVSPGTYAETLTVPKLIASNLKIRAVDLADRVWHVLGTVAAGANTTVDVEDAHVVSNDEWNGGYIATYGGTAASAGQARVITDSAETNNRLTVATWETNPNNASLYVLTGMVIVSNGTNKAADLSGVRNLTFEGIAFKSSSTTDYAVTVDAMASVIFQDCVFAAKYGVIPSKETNAYFGHCAFIPTAGGYGFVAQSGSFTVLWESVAYGAKSTDVGIYGNTAGRATIFTGLQVRHCATGVMVDSGGEITGSITYLDNTANSSPASFAAHIAADGSFIGDIT
jgi:hypothetical protein